MQELDTVPVYAMLPSSLPLSLCVWALLACDSSAAILFKDPVLTRAVPGKTSFPERFYTAQALDHFEPSDSRRWSQRYFENFEHFRPGGPVFLYIGGEGPLSETAVNGAVVNELFASRLHGATIALEHRFYGKSQPFDSLATPHLQYLSARQALHDLDQFQRWITANRSLQASRFVCMGGSYPGMLAAWYRLEFPGNTVGCWAASAPVQATEIWPGFGQMVWRAVATDRFGVRDDAVSTKLYAGYNQLASLLHDSTSEAFRGVAQRLNVCPGTLVSADDKDNWEAVLTSGPGGVMQYNNTGHTRLADVREAVVKAETALEAAFQVAELLNQTKGPGPGNCTDNSIGSQYRQLGNATLPADGQGNAGRAWIYQTCSEFGFFQTATASLHTPTMYTHGVSSRSQWQQICSEVFQIDSTQVAQNVQRTNDYFGGKHPRNASHIFFSNGQLDAWGLLSVTSTPPGSVEVFTETAPLGSHCVGLYKPSLEGDLPGAAAVREKAYALFQDWIRPQQAVYV